VSTTTVKGSDSLFLYEISLNDYLPPEEEEHFLDVTLYIDSNLPRLEVVTLPNYAIIDSFISILSLEILKKGNNISFPILSELLPLEKIGEEPIINKEEELLFTEKNNFSILINKLSEFVFREIVVANQIVEEVSNLLLEELYNLETELKEEEVLDLVEKIVLKLLTNYKEDLVFGSSNTYSINFTERTEFIFQEIFSSNPNFSPLETIIFLELFEFVAEPFFIDELSLSYSKVFEVSKTIKNQVLFFDKVFKTSEINSLANLEFEEFTLYSPRLYILEDFNFSEKSIIEILREIIGVLDLAEIYKFSISNFEIDIITLIEELTKTIEFSYSMGLNVLEKSNLKVLIEESLKFILNEEFLVKELIMEASSSISLVEKIINSLSIVLENKFSLTETIDFISEINEKGELSFNYSIQFSILDFVKENLEFYSIVFVQSEALLSLFSELKISEIKSFSIEVPEKSFLSISESYRFSPVINTFGIIDLLESFNNVIHSIKLVEETLTLREIHSVGSVYVSLMQFFQNYFSSIGGVSFNSIYDLKDYDLKRQGNGLFLWIEKQDEDYIGFGNEIFGKYVVGCDLYLFGVNTDIILNNIVAAVNKLVGDYDSQFNSVGREVIVWIKLLGQRNFQRKMRGATKYRFVFEIMVYNTMKYSRYGINMGEV
jgi:hypothetical protein